MQFVFFFSNYAPSFNTMLVSLKSDQDLSLYPNLYKLWRLRLFSFGGYGLALAALAFVVFCAIECPPDDPNFGKRFGTLFPHFSMTVSSMLP